MGLYGSNQNLSLPPECYKGPDRPNLTRLKDIALWSKHYEMVCQILRSKMPSRQQADSTLLALNIQISCNICYASAEYLSAAAGSGEKLWDRTIGWLRGRGWAKTWRLVRPDGTYSTNLIDLRSLWEWIVEMIKEGISAVEQIGRDTWFKRHGVWVLSNPTCGICQPAPP